MKESVLKKIQIGEEIVKQYKNEKKNVISFSMLNTLNTCNRQYVFNYLSELQVDTNNVYTYLGTLAHTIIEKLYIDTIDNNKAKELWLDGINNMDYYFVDYTRTIKQEVRDEMYLKNKKYIENYNLNMLNYFENFKKIDYKDFLQEKTVSLELKNIFKNDIFKDYIFKGIIDFIGINEDGSLDIWDYKTSTMYTDEKLKIHSYQLIIYAMCLESLGYKINKLGWNFLKYAKKIKKYKNGKIKEQVVERKLLILNDEFKDYLFEIEYNNEVKKDALNFIFKNINLIEKIKHYKETLNLDANKFVKCDNNFFCENLCSYYKFCNTN